MKRDWDLLRQQLTEFEEGGDVLAEIPDAPKWTDDLTWEEYDRIAREHRAIEERIAGHLELLIVSGYVEGITVLRGADNHFSYGVHAPRLTMAGRDLLDTMRSSSVWEAIKGSRPEERDRANVQRKALSGFALKQVLGG